MKKLIDILPLVIFVILIGVLFSFLSNKNNQLETVLIDDTFPKFLQNNFDKYKLFFKPNWKQDD